MKDQIFISYRREGGETMAQLLHDRLTERGFSVFYDIESLKSGPFDAKLLRKIEECDDVVLVLPPQGLDRCIYDEDWVRQEIRHALKCKKNIIPIMCRGFVFPPNLPTDIQAIASMNGVGFETMDYLEARIDKIVSMLRSKSSGGTIRHQGSRSLVRNVCSLGSRDLNNAFPKDGFYSEVIDRDQYPVIYFHISTAFLPGPQIKSGFRIYNEKNLLIFEDETVFDWKPHYDKLSRSWIIRGEDGSYVTTGLYRAEFWIEDSAIYEYYFRVVSATSQGVNDRTRNNNDNQHDSQSQGTNQTLIQDLERKLSRPKGFLLHLITTIGFYMFLISVQYDSTGVILTGLLLMVVGFILLVRYTIQYVWRSSLGAFFLCLLANSFYGIYLFFTSVVCLFKGAGWKRQLNELKSIVY